MKSQDTRSASSWGQNYFRYAKFFICGVPFYLLELQQLFLIVSEPSVGGGQKDPISLI